MAVRIRLTKTGKKHQISYRIVAQDAKSKRDGKFLEILGFYNPSTEAAGNLKIDQERLNQWLAKGAKPTETVSKLIQKVKASQN